MRFIKLARRYSYDFRSRRKKTAVLCGIVLLSVLLLIFFLITLHFRPLVAELAVANATDIITLTVNHVISEKMADGSLDYNDLVALEKDANGNIAALVTNMANINVLQAEITNLIVERFSESDLTKVSIPLGSLIGGTIFSGRGPRISADVISVTNVSTSFRNEFSSAGINQTRHQIMLDVKVGLRILFANYRATDSVLTEISIAETVIVGSVPGTYADIK